MNLDDLVTEKGVTGRGHVVCRLLGQACHALLHGGSAEDDVRSRQATRSGMLLAQEARGLLAGDTFWY